MITNQDHRVRAEGIYQNNLHRFFGFIRCVKCSCHENQVIITWAKSVISSPHDTQMMAGYISCAESHIFEICSMLTGCAALLLSLHNCCASVSVMLQCCCISPDPVLYHALCRQVWSKWRLLQDERNHMNGVWNVLWIFPSDTQYCTTRTVHTLEELINNRPYLSDSW